MYTLKLASCGNPDYGQDPNKPGDGPFYTAPIARVEDAPPICRAYIERYDLGSGNWAGGKIRDERGTLVAKVSYNGRIWKPDGTEWPPRQALGRAGPRPHPRHRRPNREGREVAVAEMNRYVLKYTDGSATSLRARSAAEARRLADPDGKVKQVLVVTPEGWKLCR